jgi:hypothetical protein
MTAWSGFRRSVFDIGCLFVGLSALAVLLLPKVVWGQACQSDADCDDGNPCSINLCYPSIGQCVFYPGPPGPLCRDSAGECDAPEYCNGGMNCPPDDKLPPGMACGDEGNPCTLDQCDGIDDTCQHTRNEHCMAPALSRGSFVGIAVLLCAAGCALVVRRSRRRA